MNDIWLVVGAVVFLAFFLGNMMGRTSLPEQRPIVVVPQVTDARKGSGVGFAILFVIALFLLLGYFATYGP